MKYPVLKSVNFLVEVMLAKLALANLTSTKNSHFLKPAILLKTVVKKLLIV